MARTKKTHAQEKAEKLAKAKGKAVAPSSTEPLNKRRRRAPVIESESEEEESESESMEESEGEDDQEEESEEDDPNATWDSRQPLSKQPVKSRTRFYMQKMNSIQHIDDLLICERGVALDDFRPFGVVQKFEKLGWEAALTFDNEGLSEVPQSAIVEWMSTLKRIDGSNPPMTTTFTGEFGPSKNKMVLSFDTMMTVAKFDSLGINAYRYPDPKVLFIEDTKSAKWKRMVDDLFVIPEDRTGTTLHKKELKFVPKLISIIMKTNVVPRYGDRGQIRHYQLKVLHGLMTGKPKYSLRHIIMMNIWESRESKERAMIPHCKLLSALIRKQDAISAVTRHIARPPVKYELKKLTHADWNYISEQRFHKLVDKKSGRFMKVLKHGLRPGPGERPVEGVEILVQERPTGGRTGVVQSQLNQNGGAGVPQNQGVGGHGPPNMELPSGIHSWEEYWRQQAQHWHYQAQQWEAQVTRDAKAEEDRKRYAVLGAVEIHELRNDLHRYHEQVRLLQDHERGLPYQAHPRPIDVSTLPPHDQCPGPHHMPVFQPSSRIPVQHTYGHQHGFSTATSSSDADPSGAVNFSDWRESFWRDIAGPPLPRRPYDDEDIQ